MSVARAARIITRWSSTLRLTKNPIRPRCCNATYAVNCEFKILRFNTVYCHDSISFRFNTKNKLAQHMVGHNNLRKWKCKTCGMSFNFKKLLQMHTRVRMVTAKSFDLLNLVIPIRLFTKTSDHLHVLSARSVSSRNTT